MAVKFNLFSVLFMVVAIGFGTMVGNLLAGWVGFAGGIIGTLLVGVVVYLIYCLLSGIPMKLFAGIIFAVFVWLANMLAGLVHTQTGFGGGLIGLFISGFILSLLWSNIGAGMAGQSTTTASSKKNCKK